MPTDGVMIGGRRSLAAICVVVALSCQDSVAPDTTPASVVLSQAAFSLAAGTTSTVGAAVTNKSGEPLSTARTFASTDPSIATVSNVGLITAVGPVGTAQVTATAGSITSAPATVTVTNAPPALLTFVTLPSSTAANRAPLSSQPSLQLKDSYNNLAPVAGIAVTAAIASGGGALDGTTTVITNAAGVATFAGLSIRGTVGTRTVSFSSVGITGGTANVSVTAGSASAVTILAGDNQTRTAGLALPTKPSVKVTDLDGNAVPSVAVTFAVTSGGGSIANANQSTSASGIATSGDWTLGAQAGTNTLNASAAGVATPAVFTASGRDPPTTCGQETILILDTPMRDGDLKSSACVVTSNTRLGFPAGPFTGPEAGGTHFYDRYVIDIPANTIARVRVADGSLSSERTLLAFETNGVYVTRSFLDPLVINNSTASVHRYQVLMTTFTAAATGTYGIVFEKP